MDDMLLYRNTCDNNCFLFYLYEFMDVGSIRQLNNHVYSVTGTNKSAVNYAGHTRKASRISRATVEKCGKGVGNFYSKQFL